MKQQEPRNQEEEEEEEDDINLFGSDDEVRKAHMQPQYYPIKQPNSKHGKHDYFLVL